MSYPSSCKRACLVTLTISFCLLLSGCVYIRLLQFKNQLKDFDRFVIVEKSDGLAFVFEQPVLRNRDFVFLTGSLPTQIVSDPEDGSSTKWIWRFEKDLSNASTDACSIVFATTFQDGLLERVDVDDALLKAMDAEFIVKMLESFGNASINKLKKAARTEVNQDQEPNIRFPSLTAIKTVLGNPTNVRGPEEDIEFENEYVFNFRDPNSQSIAGQFKVIFQSRTDLDSAISGFVLSGKGR